jgi:hypothetical protein
MEDAGVQLLRYPEIEPVVFFLVSLDLIQESPRSLRDHQRSWVGVVRLCRLELIDGAGLHYVLAEHAGLRLGSFLPQIASTRRTLQRFDEPSKIPAPG